MTDSIEVTLCDAEQSAEGSPPKNAVMFLLWLQKKLADVPACYRNKVRIEIGHAWDRGSYVRLSYLRPAAAGETTLGQTPRAEVALEAPPLAALTRRDSRLRSRSMRRHIA